jgi:hypothetical protein
MPHILTLSNAQHLTRASHRKQHHALIAPLQLGEEFLRIHCAHFDEALVTAALYSDARDLKSACNVQNWSLRTPSLITFQHQ